MIVPRRTVYPAYRKIEDALKIFGMTVPQLISVLPGMLLAAGVCFLPLPLALKIYLVPVAFGVPPFLTTWATLKGTSLWRLLLHTWAHWTSPRLFGPGPRTRGPRLLVLYDGPPPTDDDDDL